MVGVFILKIDVNNKENVSGMLLYVKVDIDIDTDSRSIIESNGIYVITLDLDEESIEIKKQLDGIIENIFK